jgi:hypothetical protein
MLAMSTTSDIARTWSVPKRRARRGARLESAPKQTSGIVMSKPPAAPDIPVSWRMVGRSGEIADAARGLLIERQAIAASCQVVLRGGFTAGTTPARRT